MKINQIIQLLELDGNIELIGSNSLNKMKYATDYDLQEFVKIKNNKHYLKILEQFQHIFTTVSKAKNVFITDFKSGVFNTHPVRWKLKDVMNGSQDIDTKHIEFVDTLYSENNTVKIDIIALVDDVLLEFSCNYYFSKSQFDKETILHSLLLDIKKYYHENKLMKMMKRVMSSRLVKNENVDDIIKLFNSKSGALYQLHHKIDVIIFVLDEHLGFDINDINHQIDNIMKLLPDSIKKQITPQENVMGVLKEINRLLMDQMNQDVLDFVN
jgi:hypothetical protein